MIKKILIALASFFIAYLTHAQEISLRKGMVIKKSAKVKKAVYQLNAFASIDSSVITVEGNNIVLDFNGATLKGSSSKTAPDEFYGLAIQIKSGKNITIKNLKARGYKIALLARNVEGLTIENCDFSYNYRQRLNSTQEKEDISDWMSYHRNEGDQWLRYGAAMYLRGCTSATIKNSKVTGGQNALMLMECNNGTVYNNDFSFNSGIGLGMYQSSGNKILYNKLNFNVRGYSHGVYNRGQDSAGILVYEQSNNNLFYKNSVTHSGDGFFLWAGQTTMDTGKGGCNDNILWGNDFSYAPTNGIEATFSRNQFTNNRIYECDHGIWGGYSYDTKINDNKFRNNRIAIAIEHGQQNKIHHNIFYADKEAIRLWGRKEQPADWAYAKSRDTRSQDYIIALNSFNNNPLVFSANRTDSILFFGNTLQDCETLFKIDSTVMALDTTDNEDWAVALSVDTSISVPNIKDPQAAFAGNNKWAGRKNIFMTPWGPYDFRYPLIWNTNPTDTSETLHFELMGPAGKWRILSVKGVTGLTRQSGTLPATLTARKTTAGATTDIEITAEFIGATFTNQLGETIRAGKPYRFTFKKFFQPINWQVRWFGFDSTTNPIQQTENKKLVQQQPPFKTDTVKKLDYAWWGGIKGAKQHTQFLTLAEGRAQVPQGTYELSVTWDDAVRVYVDEKLVLDEWNPSRYLFDESPNRKIRLNLGGVHIFRVEHVELGGFATLSVKLNRAN